MTGPQGLEHLAQNEPALGPCAFVLNDPGRVVLVQRGEAAVFSAETRDGEPVGPRRYLFKSGPGALLLGHPSDGDGPDLCAVPIGAARLVRLTRERLRAEAADADLLNAVACWTQQLTQALPATPWAEDPLVLSQAGAHAVTDALIGANGRPLWPVIEGGALLWMGENDFRLTGPIGFPLSVSTGYVRETPGEVVLHTAPAFQDIDALLTAVCRQQGMMRRFIGVHQEAEREKEAARLRRREDHRDNFQRAAFGEMADLLKPGERVVARENPLLTAVAAIGATLDVPVKGPDHGAPLFGQTHLEAIAQASHLRLRPVHFSAGWWRRDSGPILAFEDHGTPVALLPIGDRAYECFDPTDLSRKPVDEALAARLTPTGYVFYTPLPDGPVGVGQIIKFSQRGRLPDLLLVLLTGALVTLLGMMIPLATALLIDHAVPESNRRLLLELGLALLAMVLGQSLYGFAQNTVLLRVSIYSEYQSQSAVWDRILRLKPTFFKQYTAGDLLDRAMAVEALSYQLSGSYARSLLRGLLSFLNLGLLYYYDARLSLVVMGFGLVYLVVTVSAGWLIRTLSLQLADQRGALLGWSVQIAKGIAKLRVAGVEDFVFADWLRKYAGQLRLVLRVQALADLVEIVNQALGSLGLLIIFGLAVNHLGSGGSGMSLGVFLAFYAAMGLFMKGVADFSNSLLAMLNLVTRCERAMPILQSEPEINEGKADPGALTGAIHLEHLKFRYKEEGPLILDDVSLHAEPGEMVAIVGPSGGGKSTLLRLILGFESPESGAVRFDGRDLAGLDVEAVRRQFGVVLQSGKPTAGTIYDNIRGNHHLSLDEAWAAARDAGLEKEIRAMPMGMHTHLNETASTLSGGQRQRLMIARALAGNPKMLLLDEATSAMDNRTQALISAGLARRKVTRLVIAHRLSTIQDADRIVVLDQGRIVEVGDFETLVAAGGRFAAMVIRQSG